MVMTTETTNTDESIASHELCEELEFITDWKNTEKAWVYSYDMSRPANSKWYSIRWAALKYSPRQACPAYDIAYLIKQTVEHKAIRLKRGTRFIATASGGYRAEGDRVADAVCSLVIKLVNAGEVPR